jgi:hypothetical protein
LVAFSASRTLVVATAASDWAVFADVGLFTSIVSCALAASGTTSALPVAETLTVRGNPGVGETTVVGEQAVTRSAAAPVRTARLIRVRRFMGP